MLSCEQDERSAECRPHCLCGHIQVPEGLSDAQQVAKLCEIIVAEELAALSMRTSAAEDGAAALMDEPGDSSQQCHSGSKSMFVRRVRACYCTASRDHIPTARLRVPSAVIAPQRGNLQPDNSPERWRPRPCITYADVCAASSSEAAVKAVMDCFAAAAVAATENPAENDSRPDVSEALAADLAARKEGVRARLAQLQQVCRCGPAGFAATVRVPRLQRAYVAVLQGGQPMLTIAKAPEVAGYTPCSRPSVWSSLYPVRTHMSVVHTSSSFRPGHRLNLPVHRLHSPSWRISVAAEHDQSIGNPLAQEAAGWEAALDQAGRPVDEAAPDGRALPDATAPAADETAAQLSGPSAAALAALRTAEAEATRAAVLKAR